MKGKKGRRRAVTWRQDEDGDVEVFAGDNCHADGFPHATQRSGSESEVLQRHSLHRPHALAEMRGREGDGFGIFPQM